MRVNRTYTIDNLEYPGLFASRDRVEQAQRVADRYASGSDDPVATREHERELRYRAFYRSLMLWAVIGIPLLLALFAALLWGVGIAAFMAGAAGAFGK